jgi:primase-polymerase (primpol)-like protein
MVAPRETAAVNLDDRELLRRMFKSRNGAEIARLYHGHADYASASDADIALCGRLAFWTGKDHAQMDRLFRASGLMREKWDMRRGDSTYGALTIAKAVANCRETYSAAVTTRMMMRGEERSPRISDAVRVAAMLVGKTIDGGSPKQAPPRRGMCR